MKSFVLLIVAATARVRPPELPDLKSLHKAQKDLRAKRNSLQRELNKVNHDLKIRREQEDDLINQEVEEWEPWRPQPFARSASPYSLPLNNTLAQITCIGVGAAALAAPPGSQVVSLGAQALWMLVGAPRTPAALSAFFSLSLIHI